MNVRWIKEIIIATDNEIVIISGRFTMYTQSLSPNLFGYITVKCGI